MTDIEIPELLASPDPATTNWVPLYNLLGAAAIQSGPTVRVYRSTAQAIPASTVTALSYSAARKDTANQWSASQPTRLTCQLAGTYLVWMSQQFAATAAGSIRQALLMKNGTTFIGTGGQLGAPITQPAYNVASCAVVIDLVPGDYVEACVQVDGATINTNPSDTGSNQHASEFGMTMLGGPQGPPGPAGAGTPGYGTSLPGSPADGQEYVLVDSVSNPTYQWRFRYNAGSSSAYKWEYVGGTPLSGFYAATSNLTTTGAWQGGFVPTIAAPRSGEYRVDVKVDASAVTGTVYISFDKLSAPNSPLGAVQAQVAIGSGSINASGVSLHDRVAIAAGDTFRICCYATVAGESIFNRAMTITPVRVS